MTSTYVRRFTVGLGRCLACLGLFTFAASVAGQSPSLSDARRQEIKSTAEQLALQTADAQRRLITEWVGVRYTDQVKGEFAPSEWSQVERPVRLAIYELDNGQQLNVDDLYTLLEHVERSVEQAVLRGARRYRIELYQRFRTDREQYDERMRQWEDVQAVWEATRQDPARRQELLSWLVSAREQLEATPTELPLGIQFGDELVAAAPGPDDDHEEIPRPRLDNLTDPLNSRRESSVTSGTRQEKIADFSGAAEWSDPVVDEPARTDEPAEEGHAGGGSWLRSILGGSGILGQKDSADSHESPSEFPDDLQEDDFEQHILSRPSSGSEPVFEELTEESAVGQGNLISDVVTSGSDAIEADVENQTFAEFSEPAASHTTDEAGKQASAADEVPAGEADQLRGFLHGLATAGDHDSRSTEESLDVEFTERENPEEVISSTAAADLAEEAEEEFEQLSQADETTREAESPPETLSSGRTTPAVSEARFDGDAPPDASGGVNVEQLKVRIAGFNRTLDAVEQKLAHADRAWSFDELNEALKELADLSWRSRDLKLYWTLLPPGERSRVTAPDDIERTTNLLRERIEEAISAAPQGSPEADRLERLRKRMALLNQDAV